MKPGKEESFSFLFSFSFSEGQTASPRSLAALGSHENKYWRVSFFSPHVIVIKVTYLFTVHISSSPCDIFIVHCHALIASPHHPCTRGGSVKACVDEVIMARIGKLVKTYRWPAKVIIKHEVYEGKFWLVMFGLGL